MSILKCGEQPEFPHLPAQYSLGIQEAGDEILSLINRPPTSPPLQKCLKCHLPQKHLTDSSIPISEESDQKMDLHCDSLEEQHLRQSHENLSKSLDSIKVTTQNTQVNPSMVLCQKKR